ncbi:porin PorA family protein [Corynebacterium caspium]|uniref:porin PorA family protein n=1 Tax=Corynebacterium caspium TaxID=234828 RepID=UPI00035CC960|nr:porin PorA family protein [Corynebacterium caspium]WKD59863.1 hypothetical protein CCASP_07420 [Corynebacterium caspium DSM 44850]
MLPRSRILSAFLLGLGCALIAAGLLMPRVFSTQTVLPMAAEKGLSWVLTDPAGKAGSVAENFAELHTDGVQKRLHITLEEPANADTVTARAGYALLRTGSGPEAENLLHAEVWSYLLDRATGIPRGVTRVSNQIASPPQDLNLEAPWWFFERGALAAPELNIVDPDLHTAMPAQRQGEELRGGREVVHYRQEYAPVIMAQYGPVFMGQTHISTDSTSTPRLAYLYQEARRDFYIDKASGLLIDLQEQSHRFYGTGEGENLQEVLVFAGKLDAHNQLELQQAAADIAATRLVDFWPAATTGAGVIIGILALIGVITGFGRKRQN